MRRYRARIIIGKHTEWLGSYTTAEEAHEAYVKRATELRGSSGFMRG